MLIVVKFTDSLRRDEGGKMGLGWDTFHGVGVLLLLCLHGFVCIPVACFSQSMCQIIHFPNIP